MSNVVNALKRDVIRLFKAPAALVVVVFLIVLPSLYTWFNVVGFWDPYGSTGNLRVCVVNEDKGTTNELTGTLNMGDQIVEKLESNEQLGWVFTDRETAMEEINSGKSYAVFLIPSDFSENTLTLLSGNFVAPQLKYYVNEKAGAVSPKITDSGANTLEKTINSTFASTVSEVIADAFDKGVVQSQNAITKSKSEVVEQLSKANSSLCLARSTISDFNAATSDATQKAKDAQSSLDDVKQQVQNLSDAMKNLSSVLSLVQSKMGPFISTMNTSMDKASSLISKTSASTNTAIGNTATAISNAQGNVQAAVKYGEGVVAQNETLIQKLKDIDQSSLTEEQKEVLNNTISSLESQNESLSQGLEGLGQISTELDTAATDIAQASTKVNSATQNALKNTDEYRSSFTTNTYPVLNEGLIKLSSTTSDLSAIISNQSFIVDQSYQVLDQFINALGSTSIALGQTDSFLSSVQSSISTIQTDVVALNTSNEVTSLIGEDGLDPEKIADFMLSPTQLETESLYEVNAYGSAMAPLFMNMSLWIGVFMLLVILRQEVDGEGISHFTTRQRYLVKWLFFAPLAMLQAVVCCAGNLFIGVQVASVPLFFLTAMLASLTYLSIQYALSITLQHIGKAFCVILIFVQIPGATGLYPIEMTPDFFQVLYPFFPFTYGINALRETIGGFYEMQWGFYVGMLLLFFAIFFIGAFIARPSFVNLNRMFSKQIKDADLFNGEDVPIPARRYRAQRLFFRLANEAKYRDKLAHEVDQYLNLYPRLRNGAFIIGSLALVLVTLFMALFQAEKVAILTFWLIWLASFIIFLIIVEFTKDRLEHESSLAFLSNEEVDRLISNQKDDNDDEQVPSSTVAEGEGNA